MTSSRYDTWADSLVGLLSRCGDCDTVIYAVDEDEHSASVHRDGRLAGDCTGCRQAPMFPDRHCPVHGRSALNDPAR